jgi:hypothetical protein
LFISETSFQTLKHIFSSESILLKHIVQVAWLSFFLSFFRSNELSIDKDYSEECSQLEQNLFRTKKHSLLEHKTQHRREWGRQTSNLAWNNHRNLWEQPVLAFDVKQRCHKRVFKSQSVGTAAHRPQNARGNATYICMHNLTNMGHGKQTFKHALKASQSNIWTQTVCTHKDVNDF